MVRFLDVFEEFLEAFMILRAIFLVHFIGRAVRCVHGIKANAALVACTGLQRQHAQHFYFFNQVFYALMNVREAVDLFARQMGRSRHQVFVSRIPGHIVRNSRGIHVAADERMVRYFCCRNPLTLQIYDDIAFLQAFLVFFPCHHMQ